MRASAVGLTVFWSVSDPIGGRAILCTDPWASVAVHNSWLPGGLAVGAHPARVGEENSAGGQSLRWSAKVDIITVAIGRQSRRAGAASERSTFFPRCLDVQVHSLCGAGQLVSSRTTRLDACLRGTGHAGCIVRLPDPSGETSGGLEVPAPCCCVWPVHRATATCAMRRALWHNTLVVAALAQGRHLRR